jgi:ISXO2-like transposase domain
MFQDTRIPLRIWFRAMWWVTGQVRPASVLGLQRALGLSRYETAWRLLHKLRRAMVIPGRDLLTGGVEVGGRYVGGRHKRRDRSLYRGPMLVAAERDERGIGRIRMRQIVCGSPANLVAFVQDSVEPGSVIHTYGGWKDWSLTSKGYTHMVRFPTSKKKPWEAMPRVQHVISEFERWLTGTLAGAIDRQHLNSYLDEFTFRFNLRQSQNQGELFLRLAQQAVTVDPVIRCHIVPPERAEGQNDRQSYGKPE